MSERATTEVDQHIAWLRQYVATMTAGNWKDMQTRLNCQLDKLTAALAAAQRVAEKDIQAALSIPPTLTDAQREQLQSGFATLLPLEEIFKIGWNSALRAAKAALALSPGKVEGWREERDELYGYVNGLLGLLQLLRGRNDIPAEVKEIMNTNHRVADAAAYLTQIVPPISETTRQAQQ